MAAIPPSHQFKLDDEAVNVVLSQMVTENKDDLPAVSEAFKALVEPKGEHTVAPSLSGRFEQLKFLIKNANKFATTEEDQNQFKKGIRDQVAAKITEISNLSPKDKEEYIEQQKNFLKEQKEKGYREAEKYTADLQSMRRIVTDLPKAIEASREDQQQVEIEQEQDPESK